MKRWLVTALAATLAMPTVALAEPTADLDRAKQLHREGQDRYDTADYTGAVERWTQAYTALPETPQGAAMKPFVLYNIASAHEKAFEIYGDVAQLRKARALLAKFESTIDDIYADADEARTERERVNERIAQLDAKIEQHDAGAAGPAEPPAEPEPRPQESAPPPADPQPPAEPDPADNSAEDRRADPRMIAGAVLVGTGTATAALLGAGLGIGARANDVDGLDPTDFAGRERQFDRGRMGNRLAIVGAVATPLLLGAGVALIIVAKRKPSGGQSAALLRRIRPSARGISVRF